MIILIFIFIIGLILYIYSKDKEEEIIQYQIENKLKILTADELIDILDLTPSILMLRVNLGLSKENFNNDALPVLKKYIELVQRLPASQNHHHSGDGGLIKHTLDVAILVLIASTGKSWPPNSNTEDMQKLTLVWRYGLFIGAVLHDIGKIITNFKIELFTASQDKKGITWFPEMGTMLEFGKNYYTVEFADNSYRDHQQIAWQFFLYLVPLHVRLWIRTDPNLIITLQQFLIGKKQKNEFTEIITAADMQSVARDLKIGSKQRFKLATSPLIETIIDTLIFMLEQKNVYFSIATGSGGDLFRVGDFVYIIAKHVPDYIREFLIKTKSEISFPNDNQRIFDILLENCAVISNVNDEKKAIIVANVSFIKNDGTIINHKFTMLKFKLTTLYPNSVNFPQEFKGKFEIINTPEKTNSKKNNKSLILPLPEKINTNNINFLAKNLWTQDKAQELINQNDELSIKSPRAAFLSKENNNPAPEKNNNEGNKFLHWLINKLSDGTLSVNDSTSKVHFINEGMLLITPAIFKAYAGNFDKDNIKCPGVLAQKGFVSLGYHQRTKKSAIYEALAVKNNNKKLFTCYLIPEKNLHFLIQVSSRPANNINIILKKESYETNT